jgi:branched-chain amino acid transport system permease protein
MPVMLLLFGVGLCARNLAYLVWTGDDRTITLSYGLSTIDLGVPVPTTRLVVFAIALTTTAGLFLVFRYTHFGRSVRAVARDPIAAELAGISVPRVSARAFGAGTALGALGGVLLATLYVINPEFGGPFLLKSFCIIVLGGMDSMPGILAGALTLGVAETAAGVYAGAAWQDLVSFILLVFILVARPGGLPSLVKS